MRNILCLSTANYYPFPTRKQNIMNRLTDCRVLYVEPPVSYIAPLKDPSCRERLSLYKQGGQKVKDHITVYAQPPVKPFFNKKRVINRSNQKAFAKYLVRLIRAEGLDEFWLWCYSPTSCDVVAPLARELGIPEEELWSRTVYDCVDRHSAYPGHIDPAVVDKMEEDLAGRAAFVFATAEGLYKRLKAFNDNCFLVPNGANYELFNRAASGDAKTDPEHPVFGFVGMLQECIDYDCMEALAKAYPQGKIEVVGRALPGVDLSRFEKYPNVEFAGLKPQEELPDIIKGFDVCLNLFADNELSANVSPLKFYEYLATGKPVVSTPVPLQTLDYKDCIYVCSGAADIASAAADALAEEPDSGRRAARLLEALKCSWDERVKEIRRILSW